MGASARTCVRFEDILVLILNPGSPSLSGFSIGRNNMTSTGERPQPYGASLSHLSMPAAVPSAASPTRAQPSPRMPGMLNAHGAANRPVLKMQGAPGSQAAPHLLPAPGMPRGPGPVSVAGAPYVPGSPRAQGPPFIPMVPGPPKTDFKHKALTQWEAESLLKR